jgi:hypothetical protein
LDHRVGKTYLKYPNIAKNIWVIHLDILLCTQSFMKKDIFRACVKKISFGAPRYTSRKKGFHSPQLVPKLFGPRLKGALVLVQ